MKKILSITIIILAACIFANAQEIAEPEFIGEVAVVKNGVSLGILEKHTVRTKNNYAGVILFGAFGKAKSKIAIEGCCAKTILKENDDFQFIIRAVDNNTDPLSVISIFAFDQKKKERRAELVSATAFGSTSNNLKYVDFTAKKYGESSYIVTVSQKVEGQYGILVTNPNTQDEKNMIIASFAIEK